jgi:hypothetical protein
LAVQPCGDGVTACPVRGDGVARGGQGGHSDGSCWWLVESCAQGKP